MMMSRLNRFTLLLIPALVACDGGSEIVVGEGPRPMFGSPSAASPQDASAGAEEAEEEAAHLRLRYEDSDFVEADTKTRDPFRNFLASSRREVPALTTSQRAVVMPETAVDEMRLIGIVHQGPAGFAMLADRQGVGHIVRQRDYIGRPEILQIGTEATIPVQINWQVYRIRDREVILRREDPSNPDGPALTRSILMADESTESSNLAAPVDPDAERREDDQARRILEAIRGGQGGR